MEFCIKKSQKLSAKLLLNVLLRQKPLNTLKNKNLKIVTVSKAF